MRDRHRWISSQGRDRRSRDQRETGETDPGMGTERDRQRREREREGWWGGQRGGEAEKWRLRDTGEREEETERDTETEGRMEERDRRVTDKMERGSVRGEGEERTASEPSLALPGGGGARPCLWPGLFSWGIAKAVQPGASCLAQPAALDGGLLLHQPQPETPAH